MCFTYFSVGLTVSGDFHQLSLMLSVCLALDFIQDQASKEGTFVGHRALILIVSLIVGFFL